MNNLNLLILKIKILIKKIFKCKCENQKRPSDIKIEVVKTESLLLTLKDKLQNYAQY